MRCMQLYTYTLCFPGIHQVYAAEMASVNAENVNVILERFVINSLYNEMMKMHNASSTMRPQNE